MMLRLGHGLQAAAGVLLDVRGMFEYHQCPFVTTLGKIHAVADQFRVGRVARTEIRERDVREGVEQLAYWMQRRLPVVEVLTLIDPGSHRRPG